MTTHGPTTGWLRRLDPDERYGLRLTLLVVAFALVTVPFATLVYQVLAGGLLTELDADVADGLNGVVHRHPLLVSGLTTLSWLGRPPVLWAVVAVGALESLVAGARRTTVYLLATTASGGLLSVALKALVDRPRPIVDHPVATAVGESFPSGHALLATVCYGALVLAYLAVLPRRHRRPVVATAAVLVAGIGASRVLLGVHFLTDVVGGFLLGTAWLAASTAVFEIWRVERGRRRSDPLSEGVEPEEQPARL